MKILIITDYFQPQLGYTPTFLAKEFIKEGHNVKVLTSDHYYPFPNYKTTSGKILGQRKQKIGPNKEEEIPTQREKLSFEIFNRASFVKIKSNIETFQPDIVIVNGVTSFAIFSVISLRKKSKLNYKILAFDSHLMSVLSQGLRYKQIIYWIFRLLFSNYLNKNIDKFVAVQEETKYVMNKFYGIKDKQIEFIPLGADTNKFYFNEEERIKLRKSLKINKDEIIIIYTGKLIKDKGFDLLIKAFYSLQKRYSQITLVTIGSGPKELREDFKTEKNSIGNKYINISFVKNTELYKYYSMADVGVRPLQESISMIEAAACNLPFIANDKIGSKLRISNKNALLYRQNDIKDLADKIAFLIDNDKERVAMGKRGRALIKEKLSWETIAKKYLNF